MCGAGSNGSLVDGVIIRDAEFHAFVPHSSDGVTFRNCIAHDTFSEAYWWDVAATPALVPNAPQTNNLTYDTCVASRTRSAGKLGVYRNTGFMLGAGTGSTIVGCVAVGVQGIVQSSGILWGEMSQGVWQSNDLVSHNNQQDGIFTWQNTGGLHVISDFVGYHNGGAGIEHGAYLNRYVYQRCVLYANGVSGVTLHALSWGGTNGQMRFSDILIDQAGLGKAAVIVTKHSLAAKTPVLFERIDARNYNLAGIWFQYTASDTHPECVDIVDWTFTGNEVFLQSGLDPAAAIRIQDTAHGSLQIKPAGQPGTPQPAWNAVVTAIPGFAQSSPAAPSSPVTTTGPSTTTSSSTTSTTAPSTTTSGAPSTTSSTSSTSAPSTPTTTGSTTSSPSSSTTTTTTVAPGVPTGGGAPTTFSNQGGSVTVVIDPTGAIYYQSSFANPGYTAKLMKSTTIEVNVEFIDAAGTRYRLNIQQRNGVVQAKTIIL